MGRPRAGSWSILVQGPRVCAQQRAAAVTDCGSIYTGPCADMMALAASADPLLATVHLLFQGAGTPYEEPRHSRAPSYSDATSTHARIEAASAGWLCRASYISGSQSYAVPRAPRRGTSQREQEESKREQADRKGLQSAQGL